MVATRRIKVTAIVAQLAVAQRRGWLVVKVDDVRDPRSVQPLLREFVRCGVLAHFEQARPSVYRRFAAYRLFLRYRNGQPVSQIWAQTSRNVSGCRLSLTALRQLARTHGGLGLLFYTNSGLLTAGECLRRQCGGILGFGVYTR